MTVKTKISKNFIISWTLVLVWMTIIFLFSAQPASVSGANSTSIVSLIINIAQTLGIAPEGAAGDMELIGMLDHLLRKATHAIVYFILAILIMRALGIQRSKKGKKDYIVAMLVCSLYAMMDEFHQLFVAGRAGMIKDVLIDSSGGVTGLLVYWGYYTFKKLLKN
jgi:VanZ family protein